MSDAERVETSAGRGWPLITAMLLFWLGCALLLVLSLNVCEGRQVYALDDAYIHLSLARNLAAHGDWGLGLDRFDSVSSSLLWPVLLSAGLVPRGPGSLTPLLLNIVLASLLLVLFDRGLRDAGLNAVSRYLLLLVLILAAPLPALVFGGMEHILQTLLALLLLLLFVDDYRRDGDDETLFGLRKAALLFCAALLSATRPEALFLILPMALAYLLRARLAPLVRVRQALWLIAAGALPWAGFGLFSRWRGGGWLPNSILAKGKGLDFASPRAWLDSVLDPLLAHLRHPLGPFSAHVLILIAAGLILPFTAGALLRRNEGANRVAARENLVRGRLVWPLLTAALLLQLLFGGVGWFFRYESWLVVLALFALCAWLPGGASGARRASRPLRVLLLVLLIPLGGALGARGAVSLARIVPATRNIHRQPVQAGVFLATRYPGRPAVVGDLGAACYLGRRPHIDLMGLATPEVIAARRSGRLDAAFVDSLAAARGAEVAVLHDRVFGDLIPESWVKAGEWSVERNVVLGGGTISFYSTTANGAGPLRDNLISFAAELPEDVEVRFYP